ncbi:hypothetical protein Trydic_g5506 [Trypoxylus dichotomus]
MRDYLNQKNKDGYNNLVNFQLPTLNNLHMPRKVTTFNEFVELQLQGFSDASEKAYGACIYIRTTNATGEHATHLLCSKYRVSQLKRQSLPRLELCTSLLLLQLYYKVKESLRGMISDSLLTIPEPNYQDVPINRLSRWHHIQKLFQHLWKRWSTEYLSQLQTRTKWYSNNESRLKEGSIVIVKEENLPPFKWKIGRIEKTFPDGVTRIVSIRTKDGSLKLAAKKLCLLPVEDN